jgi:hypothetical protein
MPSDRVEAIFEQRCQTHPLSRLALLPVPQVEVMLAVDLKVLRVRAFLDALIRVLVHAVAHETMDSQTCSTTASWPSGWFISSCPR